jgi:serine protease Do
VVLEVVLNTGKFNFSADLDGEMIATMDRVKRSLVQVVNGHMGAGAGIVWREDGVILTNNHVAGRHRITVILADGRQYQSQLVERNPEIDMAILKIDGSHLPVALVADTHQLRIGQLVFAVGHPWGQVGYVTAGIISALGTLKTSSGQEVPYIRSDAPLAPGNSGGPLVNVAGGVLGINTMIIGGDQGVALPIHVAKSFIERVLQPAQPVYA